MQKKKVVVIGGGSGVLATIRALKKSISQLELSAVISVADSGSANGRLRERFKIIPPSDVMRNVLAMSNFDFATLWKIFYTNRYEGLGEYNGHYLGNLFLALSNKYTGKFIPGLKAFEQSLEVVGHVYPVTLDRLHLCVELSNGKVVKTEGVIDRPSYDRSLIIKRAWLEPKGRIYSEARQALLDADYIVIGPGSLYTSLISTILVNGVKQAINQSKAKIIFVCSTYLSSIGETGPTSLSGLVDGLEKYLPRPVDYVIYNNKPADREVRKLFLRTKTCAINNDLENLTGRTLIGKDFKDTGNYHSPEILGKVLHKIIV